MMKGFAADLTAWKKEEELRQKPLFYLVGLNFGVTACIIGDVQPYDIPADLP